MNNIQGVLFDADGTLIDTYDIILASMRYTINDVLGCDLPDEALMAGVGTPLYDQMLGFAEGDEALAEHLLSTYREHNVAVHDASVRAFPDTRAALERLRAAGVPMGVVTSKRHALAQRGLDMGGIGDLFDVLIAPDDWPEHKPAPGPILRACELMGLDASHCLYVGDSPFDMQAGNAAGCATVAALWGMFPREALAAENPTMMCDSLGEMAERLPLREGV
ncbi:HAD-IA family hydrolase [Adlercreutzia sp. R7]|uniref:HAD-IA family hydrolase n=1 Tax=Adlercreutzia wanghongyangiae TaxID=3111451 RepID=A0ABU6IF19_9ACTN|nr:HAD-IA family hydrolase [Adlercreutzia sp. R7]